MFLFTNYAFSQSFQSSCIVTVDSDAGILSLYYSTIIEGNVYLHLRSKCKTKILDISNSNIDTHTKKALQGLPSLTRCDSTSSFYGKEKVKALKTMNNKQGSLLSFTVPFREVGFTLFSDDCPLLFS